jgi:hypothetical protein
VVVVAVLIKQKNFEARTLDLNPTFFLCAMWDDDTSLNFNNFMKRPTCSGNKKALARAGGGKIGGTRLELGIAGRKKTAFYALCNTF